MFIVENGKITNDKTFDIGESRVTNFVFKFDIAFDDADKFELDLSGNKFNLYGFTDAGCLRFSYVDVSEIIKKANTDLAVKVTCNGDEILADSITITAYVQGGGSGEEIQGFIYDNAPSKATTVQIIPETLTADITDFSNMFDSCQALTSVPALDTSKGTDFSSMFYYCSKLTEIPPINTSKGTDFSSMFYYCSQLTEIPQLDVSNATNCQDMFYKCERLKTIPALNTSKVTEVGYMFYYCSQLTTIEGIDFSSVNHNITNTFYYNPKLTSVKVNGTIAKNIDFSGAKNLDAASCISIAQALVVNTGTLTITFNSTTYNNVLLETIMPNTQLSIKGYIVSNKGWAIKTA